MKPIFYVYLWNANGTFKVTLAMTQKSATKSAGRLNENIDPQVEHYFVSK